MTAVLIRKDTEEKALPLEAETGAMLLQPTGPPGSSDAEKVKEGSFLETSEGKWPC